MYIYDAGISPEYQGRVIGKALIRAFCKFCEANEFEDAYVETEFDNRDEYSEIQIHK